MRHVVIIRPGGYDRLVIEDAPDLVPTPGHVIVDVEAAGVNYADCIVRMGLYKSARTLMGYPMTPGFEFAGRVAGAGDNVRRFAVGQHVYGVTLFNGYATQVSVPEHQLFTLPAELTVLEAATFPVAFLTAWYAALKLGQAASGMTALVHAAAGGVGSALTQILTAAGCDVVGVVGSSEKISVAKNMGCREVIDKSAEPLWSKAEQYSARGYDLIFDSVGVATLGQGYRHLAPMGKLVTYGFSSMLPRAGHRVNVFALAMNFLKTPRFNPIHMADDNRSVLGFNLSFLFEHKEILEEGMRYVLHLLQEHKLRPLPVVEYPAEDVSRAHRDLESGRTTGKLALRMRAA